MNGNMCVSGFPGSCRLDRCPKVTALVPPAAFTCDMCGEWAYVGELEYAEGVVCYETPENKKICNICADSMTVWDALIFLGCLVAWE